MSARDESPRTPPDVVAPAPIDAEPRRDGARGHEPMREGTEAAPRGVATMAFVRWMLVLAMAIAAAASVASYFHVSFGRAPGAAVADDYYCPMHPSVHSDHPGTCPICSMDLVKRESTGTSRSTSNAAVPAIESGSARASEGAASDPYNCPMHPDQTSTSPDAHCPICGMKMERRPAVTVGPATPPSSATMVTMVTMVTMLTTATGTPMGSAAMPLDPHVPGLVPIELTFDRVQLVGMKTAKVTKERIVGALRTVGYVSARESGLVKVNTRYSGWIESLLVAETGAPVKRGQLLALLYSPEIYLAEQEYATAHAWEAAKAGGTPDAGGALHVRLAGDSRKRLELLGVPDDEIAAIEKTGKAGRTVGLHSPASGYVVQKGAIAGMYVQPGADLFTIADLAKVWVLADVYERDLPRVGPGVHATLSLVAYPDAPFVGDVTYVYPTVDPSTRTARVRIELPNKEMKLRPGMYGDVSIELPAFEALTIPRGALVDTGGVQYVFLDQGKGRFEPRRVRVAGRSDDNVRISEGIAEGDVVVTTGNFLLDSESRLRATIDAKPTTAPAAAATSTCDRDFDVARYPDKVRECRACEVQHRGMGGMATMEQDCKDAIARPWK